MKELWGRKTKETKHRAQSHSTSDVIHLYPFAETGPFGSYSSLAKWRCSLLSHWAVGRQNRHACILQSHGHQCVILGNQYLYPFIKTYFQTPINPSLEHLLHSFLFFSVSWSFLKYFSLCPCGSLEISFKGSPETFLPCAVPSSSFFFFFQ